MPFFTQNYAYVISQYKAFYRSVLITAQVGIDQKELLDALQEPDIKQRLVDETDGAIKKGVFGSPFVIADGEPFFGVDRFEILDEWLVTEGFWRITFF